jgi:hypothetical protein
MAVTRARKNGGFVLHWVRTDGPFKGEALCGMTINKRAKRSYWVGSSRKADVVGVRSCATCDRKKQEKLDI